MSRIIILILIAVMLPETFYLFIALYLLGNVKKALMRAGISEEEFNAIATGRATIKKCE